MAGSSKKTKKRAPQRRRSTGNPAKRPVLALEPVTARDWIGAARLRTLPLAIAPVVLGTGAAQTVDHLFHWAIALACLAVAVLLQIGVNFANDYSDGIRGTDAERIGPARLTASGRVPAKRVLLVALVFFALAAVAGLAVIVRSQQWWMLAVGAACIVATCREQHALGVEFQANLRATLGNESHTLDGLDERCDLEGRHRSVLGRQQLTELRDFGIEQTRGGAAPVADDAQQTVATDGRAGTEGQLDR